MVVTLGRRAVSSLVSILILTMVVFGVSELTPGGPATTILGLHATAGAVKALNASMGLDRPFFLQYLDWWGHVLHGNLGYSYTQNETVTVLLGQYLGNTFALDAVSLFCAVLLSLIIGMVQGALDGTWVSKAITTLQFALYAMPIFWLALILISVFSISLGWFPSSGSQDLADSGFNLPSYIHHMVLPAISLTLVFTSFFSRYMGAAARLEFQQAYVMVARAKGAAPWRVATLHVLRNAARPLITQVGLFLPWIFAGGVVVEQVFNFPGLGYLLWQSALQHDYPVLTIIVLLIGMLTIIGNLLADILNGLLDRRVHYA
jgi:peptide/nickel transport system permease protein